MLRLILIRHAKSAWNAPDLDDFSRPLAPRGRSAARWIGDTLRGEGWVADLVLCSPAARTRETLSLSAATAPTQFVQEIYDLMAADFVELIRTNGGAARSLMLVGHNSAIEATALALCSGRMDFGGFPTGAIVVLDFEAADWRGLVEGTGQLVAFCRPPRQ
jgi:phosphohistidine phosphatase